VVAAVLAQVKALSAPARAPDAEALARLHGLEWRARAVMEGFLAGLHGSPFHGPSVEFKEYRTTARATTRAT
jgi:hypothetical protein